MSGLIPADGARCQAEKPNGAGPFTVGGTHRMVRCTNKPKWLATETRPGADGEIGSMSLCADCRVVFDKQVGDIGVTMIDLDASAITLSDERIIELRKGPRFVPLGTLEPWAEAIAFARAVIAEVVPPGYVVVRSPENITPEIEAAIKEVAPKWFAPSVYRAIIDVAKAAP